MGVARYVNMAFVAVGLLGWIIFAELFGFILSLFGAGANMPLIGVNFRLADLIGLIAAAALAIGLRRNEKVSTYALEVGNELSKVTWPSWPETKLATVVVIITTVVIALILGAFDWLWSALSGLVYDV